MIALMILALGLTAHSDPFAANVDQCTEYVEQYVHTTRGFWMEVHGDARWWGDSAARSGYVVLSAPHEGDILVMQPGNASDLGHVAIVLAVEPERLFVDDANWYEDGKPLQHWVPRADSDRFIFLGGAP